LNRVDLKPDRQRQVLHQSNVPLPLGRLGLVYITCAQKNLEKISGTSFWSYNMARFVIFVLVKICINAYDICAQA